MFSLIFTVQISFVRQVWKANTRWFKMKVTIDSLSFKSWSTCGVPLMGIDSLF